MCVRLPWGVCVRWGVCRNWKSPCLPCSSAPCFRVRGPGGTSLPSCHSQAGPRVPGSLDLMLTWGSDSGTSSCSCQLQWYSVEMAAVSDVTVSLSTVLAKRWVYILPVLFPRPVLVSANFPSLILRPQVNTVEPHYPPVILSVSVSVTCEQDPHCCLGRGLPPSSCLISVLALILWLKQGL